MAVSVLLKKNIRASRNSSSSPQSKKHYSRISKETEAVDSGAETSSSLCRYRIPFAILILFLIFLWSFSVTIISGSYVHVCISSRKLNNLYCLSAGTHPNNISHEVTSSIPDLIITSPSETININNSTSTVITTTSTTSSSIPSSPINPSTTSSSVPPSPINPTQVSMKKVIEEMNQNKGNITNGSSSNTSSEYIYNKDDGELVFASKVIEQQLQVFRSWRQSTTSNNGGAKAMCEGRGIFVYDLPSKFNKDLMEDHCSDMVPWMNFCEYFENGAMGRPIPKLGKGWYKTHQYSLEPIFHSKVLKHPCRVHNEKDAKLFYVPYYGGLDILRWHFKNATDNVKDMMTFELMNWLQLQQPWTKNSGKDHVFVLGKISWDFRRTNEDAWGTRLLELDQMQNPLKLLIERQPWHPNDIGIPHPTYFHPHSDNDISEWQSKIIGSSRKSLISFAGAPRPESSENIRAILIKQCTSRDDEICRFLNCKSGGCDQPESVLELFLESEFCLQPPGDSPTRKSIFDSLISGCIPVILDPFSAYYQYPWHLPEDHRLYSIFIPKEEVKEKNVDVVDRLMKVSKKERDDMRRYIVYELMPRLVYGEPNSELDKFEDAFSVSINSLLNRVSQLDLSIA